MRKRMPLGVLVTMTLLAVMGPARADYWLPAGSSPDAITAEAFNYPNGTVGLSYEDTYADPVGSYLRTVSVHQSDLATPPDAINFQTPQATRLCSSIHDPHCQGYQDGFQFVAMLSPCSDALQTDCVEAVWAVDPTTGVKTYGTPMRTWPNANAFAADTATGIPNGGAASTWRIPGANAGGSDEFGVSAELFGWLLDVNNVSTKAYAQQTLRHATLQPVREVQLPLNAPAYVEDPVGGMSYDLMGEKYGCMFWAAGVCVQRSAFTDSTRYGMSIRLANPVSGWFNGRLDLPEVSAAYTSDGGMEISIEASPVTVPFIAVASTFSSAPSAVKQRYFSGSDYVKVLPSEVDAAGNYTGTSIHGLVVIPAGDERALDAFRAWQPLIPDQPLAMHTEWYFANTDGWGFGSIGACTNGNKYAFSGIVTTNAIAFSMGGPTFDTSTGMLRYDVAATHSTVAGTPFLGVYNLLMRDEVVRCLYHFTNAPIQASVSVADDAGATQVATYVVSDKNGWLALSAAGFHYSIDHLLVSMQQAADVTPTPPPTASAPATKSPSPTPTPTPTPAATKTAAKAAPKATTITCVKGKSTKKVTAVNPKCPSGWKKK